MDKNSCFRSDYEQEVSQLLFCIQNVSHIHRSRHIYLVEGECEKVKRKNSDLLNLRRKLRKTLLWFMMQ